MSKYPITVKVRARLLEELANSECGRWEDHGAPDQEELQTKECESCGGTCVESSFTYLIAQRHKNALEVRNREEASEIYWAIATGTFQIGHLPTAKRIADALVDHVDQSFAGIYYPTGR